MENRHTCCVCGDSVPESFVVKLPDGRYFCRNCGEQLSYLANYLIETNTTASSAYEVSITHSRLNNNMSTIYCYPYPSNNSVTLPYDDIILIGQLSKKELEKKKSWNLKYHIYKETADFMVKHLLGKFKLITTLNVDMNSDDATLEAFMHEVWDMISNGYKGELLAQSIFRAKPNFNAMKSLITTMLEKSNQQ